MKPLGKFIAGTILGLVLGISATSWARAIVIDCDKTKYRVHFTGDEGGAVATLFIRVTREALAPYGLGTLHTVTVEG
jgi:hypothetical protein